MKPTLSKGQLITWKDDKGFGFIKPEQGGQEIFLHISEIKILTRRPRVGDTIGYNTITQNGKLRACDAFIVGDRQSQQNGGMSLYPIPLKEAALLSLLPLSVTLYCALTTRNLLPIVAYLSSTIIVGALTMMLYADDKARAKQGKRRIPEKTLHFCELAGGWLGGFIAQRRFHHKNKKASYQIEFWAIVTLHYAGWLWLWVSQAKQT
jgi:uncharacterized membrane protein YsdA (DUF1294 family)/cold shock CspA family protein